jgi:uncharacterized protein YdeI (YjbR/CyaY-like superfamily)
MASKGDLPIVECDSQKAWAAWLERNHADADGVWLRFAKKTSGVTTVTYGEAVEEALCYGWIDGQAAGHDETYYLQRFTPRRRRSKWSLINREKAERLIAEKRMKPAGLARVDAAKEDGRWDAAYPSPSLATVPDDLQEALDRKPEAKAFFETLTSQNRYAILYRVHEARRPDTRAKRIAEYVAMLAEGRTLH